MSAWFILFMSWYGIPIVLYLAFLVPALAVLRRLDLDDTARAVWALTTVAIPVMGPVAFACFA